MGQSSYDKPIQHTRGHEYVHVFWLYDEGGAKAFLRKKLAMHKLPEHIAPAPPMFQSLSREKGDTNSFGSLQLRLSFSHRATGMPALTATRWMHIQPHDGEGLW